MALQTHTKRTPSQDSDFPHTFAWSWSSEILKECQSFSQSLSSEILRFDNLEIIPSIPPSIIAVLDRTTLDVEFDHSCLDGLDDQLLNFPTDSYAAICWAEAVSEPVGAMHGHRFLKKFPEQDEPGSLTDDTDSDTDECRTFNEHGLATPIESYSVAVPPQIILSSPTKSHFFTSFESNEKFILEPRLTHFDPAESIGLFPTAHPKVKTTGVAALRAYLPLRRKKSHV
ncbi:hypothetical protein H0H87_004168 [Tephrocybe sp. NHM501043]|nr:hypothetical protein H0H87_004168 [Tephrocybe sp. NHM501043]